MDAIILAQECLEHLLSGKLPPSATMSLLLSKALGYAIIAGAAILKVPQILAIWKAGNAKGMSTMTCEIETFVFAVHTCYGFARGLPVSTWGEAVLVLAQNVILQFMLYSHNRAPLYRSGLALLPIVALMSMVKSGLVSAEMVAWIYAGNIPLFSLARALQIWEIFSTGSTGQLSVLTTVMSLAGTAARIFTSVKEKAGPALVSGFAVGFALNAILMAQFVYYNWGQITGAADKKAKGPSGQSSTSVKTDKKKD